MSTIAQTAKYVRSKNAGPFWITIDIFFDTEDDYKKAKLSENLNQTLIAFTYGVKEELVKQFYLDDLHVVKISIPRLCPQGGAKERDMHAGQQYLEILDLEL